MIIRVSVVLRGAVWGDIDWCFDNLSRHHYQSSVNYWLSVITIQAALLAKNKHHITITNSYLHPKNDLTNINKTDKQ